LSASLANADKRLEDAYKQFNNESRLVFSGWDERLGAGFENPQIEEAQNTYKMLCIRAWREFAKAMSAINRNDLAIKYEKYAATKESEIQGNDLTRFGLHAVSEAINAGITGNEIINQLADEYYEDRLNRLSYSPFNQYFILQAMASIRKYDAALTTIKDNWGGQLRYGGTTFFEVYRPSWNMILGQNDAPPNNQCGYTSLAHPWGAGVTKWLSENILGVKPVEAGFRKFDIIPYLKDDLKRVSGTTPTPYGIITSAFNTESGDCSIIIPRGTEANRVGILKLVEASAK
jgi:alpha-L-rhamnosidase